MVGWAWGAKGDDSLAACKSPGQLLGCINVPGLQASTIKKHLTQLAEVAPFVNSKHCPHKTNHPKSYMQEVDQWYTNTITKLQGQVTSLRHQASPSTHGLTLTEVWDATRAELAAYHQEVSLAGLWVSFTSTPCW